MRWVTLVTLLGAASIAGAQETSSGLSGMGGAPIGAPGTGYEGDARSGGTFGTSGVTETTHQLGTTLPGRIHRGPKAREDVPDGPPAGSISNPYVSDQSGDPVLTPAR